MKGLIVRLANSSEVQGFIQWGLDEGWNMPLRDPPTYFESYPEGWMIAEVEGVVVGKLYSTAYPSGLGHIGYIIVGKEWRGKGVGTALLRHSLDAYLAGSGLGVGLYSAAEELPFYKTLGFTVVQKVVRMSRVIEKGQGHQGQGIKDTDADVVRDMNHDEKELEAVAQFDAKFSGAYRPRFWAQFPKGHVALVLGGGGQEIIGVGAIRPLAKSTRLGPIYGTSSAVAGTILRRLLDQVGSEGGGEVGVDAFTENEDGIQLFESEGFKTWNEAFLLLRPSPRVQDAGQERKMTYAGAVTPSSRSAAFPPHPSALNHKNIFAIASLDFN